MVLRSLVKNNLLFRITDPLKRKSPLQKESYFFQLSCLPVKRERNDLEYHNCSLKMASNKSFRTCIYI